MTTTTDSPKRYITCIHCGRKFEYEPPIAQEKYAELIKKAAQHGRHCPKDPILAMLRALGDALLYTVNPHEFPEPDTTATAMILVAYEGWKMEGDVPE